MNEFKFYIKTILLLILGGCLPYVHANTTSNNHDHAAIFASAAEYLKTAIHLPESDELIINTGRIDSRVKLKQCDHPIEHFLPQTPSDELNIRLVGARCSSPQRWQLYLPVSVDILTPAVVAHQPLSKDMYVGADDLKIKKVSRRKLKMGYFQDIEDVTGQVAKQFIGMNSVIKPRMVLVPKIVNRGQYVTIIAKSGNLRVTTKGQAMSNGRKGEVIKVKNPSSNRVIDAIVVSHGRVEALI